MNPNTPCFALALLAFSLGSGCAFANAQTATEIYLFDVAENDNVTTLANGRNITRHKGYDNQPHFHSSEPLIYFSSFNDEGRSDIKTYNWQTDQSRAFTQTEVREYSPTLTPDGKFISCIIQRDDGAQDLGKYPVDGGEAVTLIDDLVVGYHAWVDENNLILFVLGDQMTLKWYDLQSKTHTTIAADIGRALHKIPGENAMSFVHKESENKWLVKRLDCRTKEVTTIVETLSGQEDLAWTPAGRMLMSDGKQLFQLDLSNVSNGKGDWQKIPHSELELTGITRIAISGDGKRVAVVADE